MSIGMKLTAFACQIVGIGAVVASFFFSGETERFLVVAGLLFMVRGDTLLVLAEMQGWKRI